MQIFTRWLGKVAQEPQISTKTNTRTVSSSDCGIRIEGVEQSGLNCERSSLFYFLRRKDVSKSWLYRTRSLKRLGSFRINFHMMKMKKQDSRGVIQNQKPDSMVNVVGNKVLPVMDSNNDRCSNGDKEKGKGDKMKTISRMKELLKWAAAMRAEKGGKFISRKVLHFRNRAAALKAVPDNDQLSIDSPKISFRWEVESCSTTSSVYSTLSTMATASSSLRRDIFMNAPESLNSTPLHVSDYRAGNWITTDSEFVVLEL